MSLQTDCCHVHTRYPWFRHPPRTIPGSQYSPDERSSTRAASGSGNGGRTGPLATKEPTWATTRSCNQGACTAAFRPNAESTYCGQVDSLGDCFAQRGAYSRQLWRARLRASLALQLRDGSLRTVLGKSGPRGVHRACLAPMFFSITFVCNQAVSELASPHALRRHLAVVAEHPFELSLLLEGDRALARRVASRADRHRHSARRVPRSHRMLSPHRGGCVA